MCMPLCLVKGRWPFFLFAIFLSVLPFLSVWLLPLIATNQHGAQRRTTTKTQRRREQHTRKESKKETTNEETPPKKHQRRSKRNPKKGQRGTTKKKNKKRNHNSTQYFPSLLLFLSVLIVAFVCLFCRWSCVCQLTSKAGSSSAEEHNRDKNYTAVLTWIFTRLVTVGVACSTLAWSYQAQ